MPITISGSTGIAGVDGSASTPAVQGTDTNTGEFFPAADTIAWATNGTERMRVNSSGNVGIGTNSPSKKLDIFNSGTTTTDFVVRNGTVSSLSFVDSGAGYTGTSTNHPFLFTTNGTERMRLDTSGNLLFNSGYGSVATAYGCRAWVNFNGTGVVAIRASGNVTSITDNGTGNYTVNFTTAMPDANYSAVVSSGGASGYNLTGERLGSPASGSSQFNILGIVGSTQTDADSGNIFFAAFR